MFIYKYIHIYINIYIHIYIYTYIYKLVILNTHFQKRLNFHLARCNILTFIILCHNVCFPTHARCDQVSNLPYKSFSSPCFVVKHFNRTQSYIKL